MEASGTFTLRNKDVRVLFEGQWRVGGNQAKISARQHRVADIGGKAQLQGTGKGPLGGRQNSGEFFFRDGGMDSAGFGALKIGGKAAAS